jgi:hypothetical protein
VRRTPGYRNAYRQAPDLPAEPGKHVTFARDHEYKRYGTVSLLAGKRTDWAETVGCLQQPPFIASGAERRRPAPRRGAGMNAPAADLRRHSFGR